MYCPWEKSRPFQKKYKKEIFDLVLPHLNFWLATEKCYFETKLLQYHDWTKIKSVQSWYCSSLVSLCSSSEVAAVNVLKKGVVKNSAKLTGKQLFWCLFSCSSFCSLWEIWLRWTHQLTFVVGCLLWINN